MGRFNYFRNIDKKRLEKLSVTEQADLVFDLINAFSLMNTSADSALLLQDLLTESEIINLAKRLRIAKLLLKGETHEEIVRELHCSYATVSKIKIWLDNAGQGLKKVLKKLPTRRKVYLPKRTPGVGYGLPKILLHLASAGLEKREREQLENFLQNMRGKTSTDRDFTAEVDQGFRNRRSKR